MAGYRPVGGSPRLGPRGRARRLRAMLAGRQAGDLRQACGFRQVDVAEALGVSHAQVSLWERFLSPPSEAYCRVVAGMIRHLEVPEMGP